MYLALGALSAGVFAAYTGADPLHEFAVHDAAVFLAAQAGFTLTLCAYYIFLVLAAICSKGGTREGCLRLLQITGTAPVVAGYYMLVWTPAMMDKMPKVAELWADIGARSPAVAAAPYATASLLFAGSFILERAAFRARSEGMARDKLIEEFRGSSVKIQEDGSLRGETELASLIGNMDLEGGWGHETQKGD